MPRNDLERYTKILEMLKGLKNNGDEVQLLSLKQEVAKNFGIIDHVALQRFLISLHKLGLIENGKKPEKVKICLS